MVLSRRICHRYEYNDSTASVQNLNLHANEAQFEKLKDGSSEPTISAAVSDDAQASISRIPPCHPSESTNPQMSAHLRLMLQLSHEYTRTPRPLYLGWRAPSKETTNTRSINWIMSDLVYRFTILFERHLQCPPTTIASPGRCLFKDVADPDPQREMACSFDCISIATTSQCRLREGAKLTDDQFR
ncbi:hypothetical protein C8Q72DRAFT_827851 [Fomitopsis betulina]|nr:hypothetical protein C8Q72DRAFT_827851 [Fomitopsis betulina]